VRPAAGLEQALLGRGSDQLDRTAPLGAGQIRLEPDRDHRRVPRGEQVGELRLRHARARRVVEHDRRHEVGVVDARDIGDPVAQPQLEHVLRELGADRLRRRPGQALLLGGRVAALAREHARRPRRLAGLALGGVALLDELVDDPVDRGVDERRRPEHDLRRLEPGDLAADGRELLQRRAALLRVRRVAGQAALEPEHAAEVRGEHGVLQISAHEHDDRLVAEVVLEALRVLEGGGAAVDERVGRRARLEPQRQRRAAEREHHRHAEHQQRPPRDDVHQARETLPLPHAMSLEGRSGASSRLGRPRALCLLRQRL
jgi:hypothetical protein